MAAPPGPPVANAVVSTVAGPHWHHTLCGCCQDMGICCDHIWCLPCQAARQCSSVFKREPFNPNWPICVLFTIIQYFTGSGLYPVLSTIFRFRMVKELEMEQNAAIDCLSAFCCWPCALCQHHRELSLRGLSPGHCCCASSLPVIAVPQAQTGYTDQGGSAV
eukprot:Sspe_Gene.14774::Locus_5125_Transcript_2_2_Confidence_0.667_Length_619::g.14774::m.14774